MGGFGEGAVLLVLEDVAEVAEGFLLGDDGDVVTGGEGGEFAGFCGGEGASGGGGCGGGGILLSFFKVGGVEVDLVGGQGLDEVLLEGEGGDGAAGEVVVKAAVLHGGPVADGGGVENGLGAGSGDELLDGLGSVEEAGGGGGGDGEGETGDGNFVAFGAGGGGEIGGGFGGELDLEAAGRDGDAAGLEGFGEVFGGEAIFWRAGGAGDVDACGERLVGEEAELAGDGDEGEGRDLGGGRDGEQYGDEGDEAHGFTVHDPGVAFWLVQLWLCSLGDASGKGLVSLAGSCRRREELIDGEALSFKQIADAEVGLEVAACRGVGRMRGEQLQASLLITETASTRDVFTVAFLFPCGYDEQMGDAEVVFQDGVSGFMSDDRTERALVEVVAVCPDEVGCGVGGGEKGGLEQGVGDSEGVG